MPYEEALKRPGRAAAGATVATAIKPHLLTLEGRGKLSISGVEEVESFDEQEIVMRTVAGGLVVTGAGLSVSRLSVDSGDVSVNGRIDALRYEEPSEERRSLWTKLFH